MALINCSECQREVSTRASSCPHCGCPVATEEGIAFPAKPAASFDPYTSRSGGAQCYHCGGTANRACTRCGKMCCGSHITWFHPIKGSGAVCTSCSQFGWGMMMVSLFVFALIALFFLLGQ